MSKTITSKSNSKIKLVASLHESKYRKELGLFVAEGYKSLQMAIEAKQVLEVFTLKEIPNLPKEIEQYIISEDILDKISSSKSPEGVVFTCKIPQNPSYRENKIIYLDHVSDPGNAGTIIRTALAFGYDAVVFSNDSVDIYNDKVIAATKGAIFAIPVIKKQLGEIKKDHQVICSTLSDKSINIDEARAEKSFILVLGNESRGVSEDTILNSNLLVKIPMNVMDSLNVSIAAGILMYHFK